MKVWIFSDLHLEFDRTFSLMEVLDADVCICAGDILDGGITSSINYLRENVAQRMPVVFVPGNHEYYRASIKESLKNGYELAEDTDNFFMLNGDSVIIDGYRFIGATLWTNFCLYDDPRLAMAMAREKLNDYKRIKLSKIPFKKFTPPESQRLHHEAAVDIDNVYRSQPDYPTVIVSHHAPSLMSVPQNFPKG
jgi:Icc-related predicted phosphoesterase